MPDTAAAVPVWINSRAARRLHGPSVHVLSVADFRPHRESEATLCQVPTAADRARAKRRITARLADFLPLWDAYRASGTAAAKLAVLTFVRDLGVPVCGERGDVPPRVGVTVDVDEPVW